VHETEEEISQWVMRCVLHVM